MPTSNFEHLPAVMHFLSSVKPTKILDVGNGWGTYGLLIRQYFEVMQGRFKKSEWLLHIDGVEIYENYKNPVWDYAYNEVKITDIRNIVDQLGKYDVILCVDVLEHFKIDEARQLARDLLSHATVMIATSPNRDYPQGTWGGNEAERHLCLLRPRDFPKLVARKSAGMTTCYVCCNKASLNRALKNAQDTCPLCIPETWPNFRARARRRLLRIYDNFKSSCY